MKNITFDAEFGPETKQVTLSQPFGTGSEAYYVLVDNFYQGRIQKNSEGRWVRLDLKEVFTAANIVAMGEHIDAGC